MSTGKRRYAPGASFRYGKPRPPKEVNVRTCPVCGAKKGEVCFKLTSKAFFELPLTHTTYRRNRVAAKGAAKPTPPDFRPMVLDETYDR